MVFDKTSYLLIFFLCWVTSAPLSADAEVTTLYQSVEQALNYSPQLKAQTYNYDAFKYELRRSRGRYLPSVDLLLGYGLEQHSDSVTRRRGADPANTDWRYREDVTLRLTQKVYDGGETSHQVSLQKALLDSAYFRIQQAAQAIALNAIAAHLDVYKQRELVTLAEKVLKVHQDIYQSLVEMEQAGAGCLADVTQTQARMARAESNVFISKADLNKAVANYERVVGVNPGELAYAEVPKIMPNSLEEALRWTEQRNPELLALNAKIIEANERVGLARSTYKPKINIELSNRYNDQLEGDPSWQNTSDAMLNLRWNLYNGGQDKAGENAALSRKLQSRSDRDAKLFELREATTAAWTTYLSLQKQKKSNRDAVVSSEKTYDAYLKQFSFSQRSLLDVLNTVRDYFQYARQLVTVSVDEIIAAHRILELGAKLQPTRHSGTREYPEDLKRLPKTIISPSAAQSAHPEPQAPSSNSKKSPVQQSEFTESQPASIIEFEATTSVEPVPLCSLQIGPCINKLELKKVNKILCTHELDARQISGTRTVKVTRLLEGVYPPDKAYQRLGEIKKTVDSAFILPKKKQLAIYVGSFHDSDRALHYAEYLEQKQIKVTAVAVDIEMQGTILVIQQIDRQTAEIIAKKVSEIGLGHILSRGVRSHRGHSPV